MNRRCMMLTLMAQQAASPLVLSDDFTDTNDTLIASHTMTRGPGWTVVGENTPNISEGNLHSLAVATNYLIVCEGIADNIHASFDFATLNGQAAFIFRYTDELNYWRVWVNETLFRIQRYENGVLLNTKLVTIPHVGYNMHRVTVDIVGTAISITMDGGTPVTATLTAFNQAATKIGLFMRSADVVIDNFRLYNVPQPAYVGYGDTLQEAWRDPDPDTFTLQPKAGVTNPVITKTLVTDVADMVFVADPHIVKDGNTWILFFEAYNLNALCNYATSTDLVNWTYGSLLTLDGQTMGGSYPHVFMVDGVWWMIHSGEDGRSIDLRRASNFPRDWVTVEKIVYRYEMRFRDVSIFQWGGYFWAAALDGNNDLLRIYYSAKLYGGKYWTEHPSSPILSGVRNSRPAGRPIVHAGGIDIPVQDSVLSYGNKTRMYRISELSPTVCTIAEKAESPVLDASGSGWNSNGMHTLDRVDSTLSIVDGIDAAGVWSIGIYEDVP
jgi:hypothetical protein